MKKTGAYFYYFQLIIIIIINEIPLVVRQRTQAGILLIAAASPRWRRAAHITVIQITRRLLAPTFTLTAPTPTRHLIIYDLDNWRALGERWPIASRPAVPVQLLQLGASILGVEHILEARVQLAGGLLLN